MFKYLDYEMKPHVNLSESTIQEQKLKSDLRVKNPKKTNLEGICGPQNVHKMHSNPLI